MQNKFDSFMKIVQKEAAKNNKCFFINSGEGHDFETETMEGEDLFGWLIPIARKKEFISEKSSSSFQADKWESFEIFAIWSERDGNISIEFKTF